jgi:hypothetical protein
MKYKLEEGNIGCHKYSGVKNNMKVHSTNKMKGQVAGAIQNGGVKIVVLVGRLDGGSVVNSEKKC